MTNRRVAEISQGKIKNADTVHYQKKTPTRGGLYEKEGFTHLLLASEVINPFYLLGHRDILHFLLGMEEQTFHQVLWYEGRQMPEPRQIVQTGDEWLDRQLISKRGRDLLADEVPWRAESLDPRKIPPQIQVGVVTAISAKWAGRIGKKPGDLCDSDIPQAIQYLDSDGIHVSYGVQAICYLLKNASRPPGFPWKPSELVLSLFPVLPPAMRPISQAFFDHSGNDLTDLYRKIILQSSRITQARKQGMPEQLEVVPVMELQALVNQVALQILDGPRKKSYSLPHWGWKQTFHLPDERCVTVFQAIPQQVKSIDHCTFPQWAFEKNFRWVSDLNAFREAFPESGGPIQRTEKRPEGHSKKLRKFLKDLPRQRLSSFPVLLQVYIQGIPRWIALQVQRLGQGNRVGLHPELYRLLSDESVQFSPVLHPDALQEMTRLVPSRQPCIVQHPEFFSVAHYNGLLAAKPLPEDLPPPLQKRTRPSTVEGWQCWIRWLASNPDAVQRWESLEQLKQIADRNVPFELSVVPNPPTPPPSPRRVEKLWRVLRKLRVTSEDCGAPEGMEVHPDELETAQGKVLHQDISHPLFSSPVQVGKRFEKGSVLNLLDVEILRSLFFLVPTSVVREVNREQARNLIERGSTFEVLQTHSGPLPVGVQVSRENLHLFEREASLLVRQYPGVGWRIMAPTPVGIAQRGAKLDLATIRQMEKRGIRVLRLFPRVVVRDIRCCTEKEGVCSRCLGTDGEGSWIPVGAPLTLKTHGWPLESLTSQWISPLVKEVFRRAPPRDLLQKMSESNEPFRILFQAEQHPISLEPYRKWQAPSNVPSGGETMQWNESRSGIEQIHDQNQAVLKGQLQEMRQANAGVPVVPVSQGGNVEAEANEFRTWIREAKKELERAIQEMYLQMDNFRAEMQTQFSQPLTSQPARPPQDLAPIKREIEELRQAIQEWTSKPPLPETKPLPQPSSLDFSEEKEKAQSLIEELRVFMQLCKTEMVEMVEAMGEKG
ncbi:MAG TPA: hypothetical protein PLF96_12935, partial [Thermotogota bacterium]|nr:hypothetical protein [Thermotogota bacterium]